jgi:putative ABC transport system permease protein
VIGVSSVTLLVTLGRSASAQVQSQLSKLGTQLLVVVPTTRVRSGVSSPASPFHNADVHALRSAFGSGTRLAPTSMSKGSAVKGNENTPTTVVGSTNDYFRVRGLGFVEGRHFNARELEGQIPACILGATVHGKLFGSADAAGATIRVDSVACRVVGVLRSKGGSAMGPDQDDLVVMPLVTHQRRIAGRKHVQAIFVAVDESRSTSAAQNEIEQVLNVRRRIIHGREADFAVHDMKDASEALSAATDTLTSLLAAVAAVSLLVGGIGIMNIMLVAVTERTREIGLRLAIGALDADVMRQFLVEAVLLASLGGVLGLGLGVLGALGLSRALGLVFAIHGDVLAAAFGFSALIGVTFGYLPARRASRLSPVVALSRE